MFTTINREVAGWMIFLAGYRLPTIVIGFDVKHMTKNGDWYFARQIDVTIFWYYYALKSNSLSIGN